jgi:hypothetical protein
MKLKLEKMSCKYGAPMGRQNRLPCCTTHSIKLHIERMNLTNGNCYDNGFAYWGSGDRPMYVAWRDRDHNSVQAVRVYVRGLNREDAKNEVRKVLPNAKFFR